MVALFTVAPIIFKSVPAEKSTDPVVTVMPPATDMESPPADVMLILPVDDTVRDPDVIAIDPPAIDIDPPLFIVRDAAVFITIPPAVRVSVPNPPPFIWVAVNDPDTRAPAATVPLTTTLPSIPRTPPENMNGAFLVASPPASMM